MAKPPGNTPVPQPLSPAQEARHQQLETAIQAQDIAAIWAGESAQVFEAVGRIKTAQFYATVSDRITAEAFSFISKSKGYIGLSYKDSKGVVRRVAHLDEFCRHFLGRSYRRCRELVENLHLLGPELYQSAEEIGFKSRDYKALKALPADDQQAVMQALDSGDKEDALSTLCRLVDRHRQARESAEKAAAETKADYTALTEVLADKERTIRKLQTGELKPAALDEQMREWVPAAQLLLGKVSECLAQIDLMIESAAQLDKPEPDTPEWAAFVRAMELLSDALGPGLAERFDYAQELYHRLDRDIDAWVRTQRQTPRRAIDALQVLPADSDKLN